MKSVVLLGPQHVKPIAARLLQELRVTGRVALVTAGWQERESDDQALIAELGVAAVNLTLHARSEEVFAADTELAAAYKERQARLRLLQDFYRVRLEHTEEAARVISLRQVDPELLAVEQKVSLALVRRLDHDHLERCREVREAFESRWRPTERDSVVRHRRELAALIRSAQALVIAGGHVAVLLNRMRLFDLIDLAGRRPIVAWSGGAMVLTEKVILFHDHPPHGQGIAEVMDAGFGLVPGTVVLPDPRRRLQLDDRERIALFAQRFAPATCVAMDHEAELVYQGGRTTRAAAVQRLTTTGAVEQETRR
ncbi:MAG TPA: Type 1 glutamine amidotransferase-like domain-containing protein [Kofleriaceae bacterium]|nr:Type 1 glutamine amidotransferase-like domain-containing protein [Kofleriaceae bacterium]